MQTQPLIIKKVYLLHTKNQADIWVTVLGIVK